jgi:hypothetical protein
MPDDALDNFQQNKSVFYKKTVITGGENGVCYIWKTTLSVSTDLWEVVSPEMNS